MSSYPSSSSAHQDHLFLTDGERHFGDHEDDNDEEEGDAFNENDDQFRLKGSSTKKNSVA